VDFCAKEGGKGGRREQEEDNESFDKKNVYSNE
jgi:hypothetical protein